MSEVLKRRMRCAVYARKSSEEGLDQEYNSIDAQRDAGHAYIASQRAEGWIAVADDYDDPAFSGGNMERPALKRLMADIEAGKIGAGGTWIPSGTSQRVACDGVAVQGNWHKFDGNAV